jgi:putative transposase
VEGSPVQPSHPARSSPAAAAIERLHEEFKRRIKTQTVLPSADTAALLFWALPPRGRSSCARSMAGTRLLPSQAISRLTSQLDQIF